MNLLLREKLRADLGWGNPRQWRPQTLSSASPGRRLVSEGGGHPSRSPVVQKGRQAASTAAPWPVSWSQGSPVKADRGPVKEVDHGPVKVD